jgi:uncharacterized membrane protein
MSDAGHLWAVGFDGVTRAEQVRGEIIKLAERHSLTLLDWTVAVRSLDGSFTVDGEPLLHPVQRGRLATFLASIALGAPPLTSAAVDAFTGGASAAGCIGNDFIQEIEQLMQPGTSVLFVVDTAGDLNAILESIRGLGGRVLKTNVDLDRARLIQSALAAPTDHPQGDSKHG